MFHLARSLPVVKALLVFSFSKRSNLIFDINFEPPIANNKNTTKVKTLSAFDKLIVDKSMPSTEKAMRPEMPITKLNTL